MSGSIVNATNLDSVRIEVLGEGRAVTIPASLILAADRVLRHCLGDVESLAIDPVCTDEAPKQNGWEGQCGNVIADMLPTPWAAMVALADELDKKGGGRGY